MEKFSTHSRVKLKNFTVFQDVTFEFCPGVNAIIGENGAGKTHLLKAMYAYQRTATRDVKGWADALSQLFQCSDLTSLRRLGMDAKRDQCRVNGHFGEREWYYAIEEQWAGKTEGSGFGKPVFIPALDMMGHSKGFHQAYNSVLLDFDLTCNDIVTQFILQSKQPSELSVAEAGATYATETTKSAGASSQPIRKLLGGTLTADEMTGRFYLETPAGKLEMPLIGEGLRKIASLVRLEDNNWLTPGATLYWDEPEVNLNPILMQAVVAEILRLARSGVQVFITTHSYVILKELDLQTTGDDAVRYFSLHGTGKDGTRVTSTDDFTELTPNTILDEYGSLFDRELTRTTGRGRNGERVR